MKAERNIVEITDKRNTNNMGVLVEKDNEGNIMRYINTDADYCVEVCPHCGKETLIKPQFRKQHCVECGKLIKPCSLCELDYVNCKECPLNGRYGRQLGGFKPQYIEIKPIAYS